jgi:hypothetical protein
MVATGGDPFSFVLWVWVYEPVIGQSASIVEAFQHASHSLGKYPCLGSVQEYRLHDR